MHTGTSGANSSSVHTDKGPGQGVNEGEALSFSLRGKATCLQRLTRMTGQEGHFLGLRQLCKGADTTCVGEVVIARVALHWPVRLSGACVRLPAPWHVSFLGPVRSVPAAGQGRCTCPQKGKQAGEGCAGRAALRAGRCGEGARPGQSSVFAGV